MGCSFYHRQSIAAWTDSSSFARKRNEKIFMASLTMGTSKAFGENSATEIFLKDFIDIVGNWSSQILSLFVPRKGHMGTQRELFVI